MSWIKTYSIANDTAAGDIDDSTLIEAINSSAITSGTLESISFDDDDDGRDPDQLNIFFDVELSAGDKTILDGIISAHTIIDNGYEIEDDVDVQIKGKGVLSINYKTELKSNVAYTAEFIIHFSGLNAGLLDKTNYYRDYVDENDKGTLVLVVEEVYTIDDSEPTLPHSAKPAVERDKTWKHVRKSDGVPEDNSSKQKVKNKKYNTRAKRHKEGNRRRQNIMEQLIDHVGLAGVLSGAFSDEQDAFEKLTQLQADHSAAFSAWKNSGRGPIYDDVTNDLTTAWLNTVVPDNASTQAMCAWMIGMNFRTYIVDKLKGNVK